MDLGYVDQEACGFSQAGMSGGDHSLGTISIRPEPKPRLNIAENAEKQGESRSVAGSEEEVKRRRGEEDDQTPAKTDDKEGTRRRKKEERSKESRQKEAEEKDAKEAAKGSGAHITLHDWAPTASSTRRQSAWKRCQRAAPTTRRRCRSSRSSPSR